MSLDSVSEIRSGGLQKIRATWNKEMMPANDSVISQNFAREKATKLSNKFIQTRIECLKTWSAADGKILPISFLYFHVCAALGV